MLDFYYAPTPNGWKVAIMLEEAAIACRLVPVNLATGEQYSEAFRTISPNGRIPALVDSDGESALSIFESGAILLHLAEKSGQFLSPLPTTRSATIQWLMWQMSALGPTLGQHGHFLLYAPEQVPYAIDRYGRETRRLYGVLDNQLALTGDCIVGEYFIADMACFPWIMTHKKQGITLDDYPHVKRWFAMLRQRQALQRGLRLGRNMAINMAEISPEMKAKFYGYAKDLK
ncbi:MAG: thiol:disulfide oxidoreductase [Gammaproteobacteria bacterium]|nr:thiol:disulfide oxidoreductase [Gammaproteobacteria bacterium]